MVAFDNSIFCLALHPDAKPRANVDRARERVEYLLERLTESNERVILPAPAFAEFLVLAGADAPKYLSVIRDNAIFRIEPFDEKASIELADMEMSARSAGNKRGSATSERSTRMILTSRSMGTIVESKFLPLPICPCDRLYR
jgi:hypothetical protein